MSTTIKGINIEFDSDTKNFNKGMAQVNKDLKSATNLSKELDKALKLDPSNVELLEKKLNSLETELSGSESKAKALEKEFLRLSKIDLNDLEKEFSTLKTKISESEKETKLLQKELSTLDPKIDTEEFTRLKDEINLSKGETKQLKAELSGVNADLKSLDTASMLKLQTESQKASNSISLIKKEIDKTDTALKQVDGTEFKDVANSANTSKSDVASFGEEIKNVGGEASTDSINAIGDAIGGTGGKAVEGASSIAGYAGSLAALGPIGMAAGAAIGVLTLGIKEGIEAYEAATDRTNVYIKVLGDAEESSAGLDSATRVLAKGLKIEVSEAADIAANSVKIFGDNLSGSSDNVTNALNLYSLTSTGLLDYEQAQLAVNRAQDLWNLGNREAQGFLQATIDLQREYGPAADDTIDSLNEFGPLFQSLGVDANGFLQIMSIGLAAGARNTDEVANAVNELNIRLGDSQGKVDGLDEALGLIGMTSEDLTGKFNEEGLGGALNSTFNAMSTLYNETLKSSGAQVALAETTAIAGALFGTYGEELVADAIAQGKLGEATDKLNLSQGILNENNKIATGILDEKLKNHELTQNQYNKEKEALDNLTATQILASETYYSQLKPYLEDQVKQGNLTKAQLDGLNATHGILAQAQTVSAEQGNAAALSFLVQKDNATILNKSVSDLGVKFGLTSQEVDNITKRFQGAEQAGKYLNLSTEELNNANVKLVETLIDTDKTFKLNASTNSSYGYSQKEVTWATATTAEKHQILGKEMSAAGVDTINLQKDLAVLKNTQATTEAKTQSLANITGNLGNAQILTKEQTDKMNSSINNLDAAQGIATKSSNGLSKAKENEKTSIESGNKNLDAQTQALKDANPKLEKYADNAIKSDKGMQGLTKSAGTANTNMSNLNKTTATWNSNPPSNQTVNVDTHYTKSGDIPSDSKSFGSRSLNPNETLDKYGAIPPPTVRNPFTERSRERDDQFARLTSAINSNSAGDNNFNVTLNTKNDINEICAEFRKYVMEVL